MAGRVIHIPLKVVARSSETGIKGSEDRAWGLVSNEAEKKGSLVSKKMVFFVFVFFGFFVCLVGCFVCVCVCVCVCFGVVFRATLAAYGGSQARGLILTVTASLYHSSRQHQILNPLSKTRD